MKPDTKVPVREEFFIQLITTVHPEIITERLWSKWSVPSTTYYFPKYIKPL